MEAARMNFRESSFRGARTWEVSRTINGKTDSKFAINQRGAGKAVYEVELPGGDRQNLLNVPHWAMRPEDLEIGSPRFVELYGDGPESGLLAGLAGDPTCVPFGDNPPELGGPHGEHNLCNWGLAGGFNDRLTKCPGAMQYTIGTGLPLNEQYATQSFMFFPDYPTVRVDATWQDLRKRGGPKPFTAAVHPTLNRALLKGSRSFLSPGKCYTFPTEFYSEGDPNVRTLMPDQEFTYPNAPISMGKTVPINVFPDVRSSYFITCVKNDLAEPVWFAVVNESLGVIFGYLCDSTFNSVGIWVEKEARKGKPWNGETLAWAMEPSTTIYPNGLNNAMKLSRKNGQSAFRQIGPGGMIQFSYNMFYVPLEKGEHVKEVRNVTVEGNGKVVVDRS